MSRVFLPILGFMALAGCAMNDRLPPPSRGADLVLYGGRVWTGNPQQPWAEAVAVHGNRIIEIGASDLVYRRAGTETRLFDLGGRLVVPGFIDAHVHFLQGGDELLAPDLRSARSAREMGERLRAAASKLPPGTWMTSGAWDHESWPGAELPTRQILDAYVPAHPVFVRRLDGHMAVANSRALEIAGVTKATADPPGGAIGRDPSTGELTGIFKDAAMDLIGAHVPDWTGEQLLERARAALEHAASLGVTGVHDMGTTEAALDTYVALRSSGELTLRINAYLPITAQTPEEARRLRSELSDYHWIRIDGVKAFADGSLGSSTALFFEPYRDQPDTSGLALADLEPGGELEQLVLGYCREFFKPAIHAIGDKANRLVLDLYRRVDRAPGHPFHPPFKEFRIEHAQHLHPDDLARFGSQGVIASMQPYHAADDGRWAEKRIGPERCRTTYAFRSLIDRGATLAFGSDWPVAPLSPLLGIHAAVTRQTLDGEHPDGWIPAEKITVEEALRAYTHGSARASMSEIEHGVGVLTVGSLADMVVLDADLFAIPPGAIDDVKVDLTIVDGRVVYDRGVGTPVPRS